MEEINFKFYVYPTSDYENSCLTRWYSLVLEELRKHPNITDDPSEALFFFPSIDTAKETNWPYNKAERSVLNGNLNYYSEGYKRVIKDIENLKYWKDKKDKHVIFDMRGTIEKYFDDTISAKHNLHNENYNPQRDIAFPPHPIVKCFCKDIFKKRKYFLTFKGRNSYPLREKLSKFHNGKDIIIKVSEKVPWMKYRYLNFNKITEKFLIWEYKKLLKNTTFALVPRGDCLFSYRLVEAMSAGAIPVIFADNWILPFSEILDYDEFAVIIKESEWENTLNILHSFSEEQIINMRKRLNEVYQNHFVSLRSQIDTLLRILQERFI